MSKAKLDPVAILGPGGAIGRRLPAYEHRSQQIEMTKAVARAIEGPGHLVVEAGTGVGKSFAYLVPAIQAADLGKKVVISTHTIALQEQLLSKDIPFLRAVMPQEFTAILVKGRSNYISLRRMERALQHQDSLFPKREETDQLVTIRSWSKRTKDGSRSDLDFRPMPSVWEAVESENGNCLGKECPKYSECFFYRARARMRNANLLIVNHALFVTDLSMRESGYGLLPEYDIAILDEAHTLEAVASEHLGLRISSLGVDFTLARLYNEKTNKGLLNAHHLGEAIDQLKITRRMAAIFFDQITEWYKRQPTGFNGRLHNPIGLPDTFPEELARLAMLIDEGASETDARDERIELTAARDRCLGLAGEISGWLSMKSPDAVYWVELETRGCSERVYLAAAPLDVAPSLRRLLFESIGTCVLTSATLCVGSPPSFDFVKSRLGLTTGETLALGSPFDYPSQVSVHLPRNLPDPSDQPASFEREAIAAIAHYLEQTQGKAFVLFTSYKMLDAAARALAPWLARRNIALYSQSDGLPRTKMVEAFKADVNSVIFGADSFWQGVDVPGEALSNVIITRLPFSVPSHPLLEARLEHIRRRGGIPFVEYQIPEAVIKLKQGFGRLIRTKTDRGIVVILDPRVLTKPYGRTFLNSLPNCPRIVESPQFADVRI
jgi:ATP-dependent DNA helicase DinG